MDSKKIVILAAILAVALAASCLVPMDESDAATVEYSESANALIIKDVEVSAGQFVNPEITDGINTVKLTQTITAENMIPVVLSDTQSRPFTLVPGTEYTITVTGTTGNVICTATYTAPGGVVVDPEYTITLINENNALVSITDSEGQAVTESTQLTGEQTLTVTVTPAQEVEVESVTINGQTITDAPYTADVTVSADAATITVTVTETEAPIDPDEPDADREFTNQITLSDGAVIDEDSYINAGEYQEVVVAGDVTVIAGGWMNIAGKLTIQEGASIVFEEGSKLNVTETGIVDVQGELVAETGAFVNTNATQSLGFTADTFTYGGCAMTVAGTVTLEGADSFETVATAKGIEISGLFTIGEDASAYMQGSVIAVGGELEVLGVATGTVENYGTVTIDSQGVADEAGEVVTPVNMTVEIRADATVDVINVYGTVTVTDVGLTFEADRLHPEFSAEKESKIVLENVSGAIVTETLVIEADDDDADDLPQGVNTMYLSGSIVLGDDYNSTEITAGSVTISGDKVEIAETTTLGTDVTMVVSGNLTVSANLTATADPKEGKISVDGILTVTGKVTVAGNITENGAINAARYETTETVVYTTLNTALADAATQIDIMGKVSVTADVTIPVGTTVEMESDAYLTVEKDVTLTVASDDRKSGKIKDAGDDRIIVDGTLEVQNLAKSSISEFDILSDTSKEVGDAMTFTNVYNALENAADGEVVEITRGVNLTLEQNVEIRSGVTLLIPKAEQKVIVDNGVTVTVNGTLVNLGTYDIADAIAEDKDQNIKAEPAGATVVNGMFLTTDNTIYTEEIVGAYFGYTYNKSNIDAIAPLASLPAIADDITAADITLYGAMTVGAVDFSAYDGKGDLQRIVAQNDLTIESLTLGELEFQSPVHEVQMTIDDAEVNANVTSVTGSIVLANGTVELDNVYGITAKNETDAEDVTTSCIRGTVLAYDNPNTQAAETASVSVTGEIVADGIVLGAEVAEDAEQPVSMDVPAGATLTVVSADFVAGITVEGDLVIAGNGIEFSVLTVTGTVSIEEDAIAATVDALYVGVTAEDYAMAGTGTVTGVKLSGTNAVAYVSPNATVGEDITENAKSTEYYADEALYLTAYALEGNDVEIDIPFTVDSAYFEGWEYEDKDGKLVAIDKDKDMVGKYPAVYAGIVREIYMVDVTADAGIGTVAIDGIVLENQGGNKFTLSTPLAAGQHTISYTLKSGYEGEATLTISDEGATVSGSACPEPPPETPP